MEPYRKHLITMRGLKCSWRSTSHLKTRQPLTDNHDTYVTDKAIWSYRIARKHQNVFHKVGFLAYCFGISVFGQRMGIIQKNKTVMAVCTSLPAAWVLIRSLPPWCFIDVVKLVGAKKLYRMGSCPMDFPLKTFSVSAKKRCKRGSV